MATLRLVAYWIVCQTAPDRRGESGSTFRRRDDGVECIRLIGALPRLLDLPPGAIELLRTRTT